MVTPIACSCYVQVCFYFAMFGSEQSWAKPSFMTHNYRCAQHVQTAKSTDLVLPGSSQIVYFLPDILGWWDGFFF